MQTKKRKSPSLRFRGYKDDWEERKLGDLIEEKWIVRQSDGNHGNLYPRSEEFADSGVPYVAASNISSDGNSIDFSTVKYLPQSRAKLFKKGVAFDGDILLAHNATVGPVLRLNTSFDKVILSTTLTLYRVDSEKLDPDFFLQNLRSSRFQNQLFETMKQSTRNQVPILAQQKLSISITPNIDEQNRIGKLLTLLDSLISANQRKLDLLKEQKKGFLQKMFPKNGARVPELRFAGFADDWEERKLSTESTITAGGDIDKSKLKEVGEYPIFANALTNDGIVGYYDSSYRVEAPAVTVTGRGDVGKAKARKVNFTPVVRLLAVKSNHDVDFLENAINNHKVLVESTGVPQLTAPQLGNYKIFFPTGEEQQKIGSFFKQLDNTIALHQRKLDLLKEQKKGYLQKMFV